MEGDSRAGPWLEKGRHHGNAWQDLPGRRCSKLESGREGESSSTGCESPGQAAGVQRVPERRHVPAVRVRAGVWRLLVEGLALAVAQWGRWHRGSSSHSCRRFAAEAGSSELAHCSGSGES